MRILIWGFVPRSPESVYWHTLKAGMEACGHQVIALDAFALAALYGPTSMQRIILEAAEVYRVNAAVVLTQNFVEPWLLEALRARGVILVSLRYDDGMLVAAGVAGHPVVTQAMREHLYLEPYCDLSTTQSRQMEAFLAGTGLPAPHYVPLAIGWQAVPADPLPIRPVVSFCGSPKQKPGEPANWRVQVAMALTAAGLPLELHHADWAAIPALAHAARPTPSLTGFFDIFRTSAVNLSLSAERGDKPYRGLKALSLEIAAAGGMQIAEPSDELPDLFTIGEDLVVAESLEDHVLLARHFLNHLDEAAQMGRNSRRSLEQRGGWDVWWQRVADLLAERGISLDLTAAPVTPSPEAAQWLAATHLGLAHAYEAQGQTILARAYFEQVRDLDPGNYAAHMGLGRLAATGDEALPHWKDATRSIGLTLPVHLPGPLGMQGVGKMNTAFQLEAALNWLKTAMAANAPDEVLAALGVAAPYYADLTALTAGRLRELGHDGHARQAVALGLQHWPEDADLRQLNRDLDGRVR